MKNIINFIIKKSFPIIFRPGQKIKGNMGDDYYCYFVVSGSAVIYIRNNIKPLAVVGAGQLVGLSQLICHQDDFTLKIMQTSEIYALSATTFLQMVDETGLWREVAYALAQEYHEHNNVLRSKNIKVDELIPQTLRMLECESEEVRLTHAVKDYVCSITGLSQSTVKRSLSTLRKNGDIEMQNGLLLRFNVK